MISYLTLLTCVISFYVKYIMKDKTQEENESADVDIKTN